MITGTRTTEVESVPHGIVMRFFTPGLEDIEMDLLKARARVTELTGNVRISSIETVGDLAERSRHVPAHVILGSLQISERKYFVRVCIDNAHGLLISATPKIILAAIRVKLDAALKLGKELDGIKLGLSSEVDFGEDGVVVVRVSESDTKPTMPFVVEIDPTEPIAYLN